MRGAIAFHGKEHAVSNTEVRAPWLPPRWFIRGFWHAHRWVYRVSGGRFGIRPPKGAAYGMLRLNTIGRRSGQPHGVIVAYLEDGPNLYTLAMNGWDDPEPAWWLNLQAHPEASVEMVSGTREVIAHAATGEERDRLWDAWRKIDKGLDAFAAKRSRETAVVVLEPAPGATERP